MMNYSMLAGRRKVGTKPVPKQDNH